MITGNYSNGLRSKDDLVLAGGTIEITAKNNAIKGKDSVSILAGNYTLNTTEGDGIKRIIRKMRKRLRCDRWRYLYDQSGRDGIQAETNLSIQSADLTIKTADGAQSQSLVTDESYKGLKAGGVMTISSGTLRSIVQMIACMPTIPSTSQVVRSLPTVVTTAYMRTMN